MSQNHSFHLVNNSPWPVLISFTMMSFLSSTTVIFQLKNYNLLLLSTITMSLIMFQWWRDVSRESTFQGLHTSSVMNGLKIGMLLFIISELFFFISFFWTFFHSSLNPSMELGMMWPPKNIEVFNPFKIPLLNTIILLTSGISVTWSHHSLINNNYKQNMNSLLITISLGIIFSSLQAFEYYEASFNISDSIYGSIFFLATGFHGIHVLIGTIFLIICFMRQLNFHLSKNHHFGFEAAIWYWHFVDIVWLFLYIFIYWWSK